MQEFQKALRELLRGVRIARWGGARAGLGFLREEVLGNAWTRLRSRTGRPRASWVECNLCGWRGPAYLTHYAEGYVDRNAFCPACKSYPRHRAFAWLLETHLAGYLAACDAVPGRRLVFAPTPGMIRLLSRHVADLEGADLRPVNAHVLHLEDLQALSFAEGSVAFVSCFHVLEHVHDDRRALRELLRVLHPAGRLVLCVPMDLRRRETVEHGGPVPLRNEHCRDYGVDFAERLEEAGLAGTGYPLHELLPRELFARLAPTEEVVYLLRRTRPGETPRVTLASGPGEAPDDDGRGPIRPALDCA